MKSHFSAILLSLGLFYLAGPTCAQVGTMQWHFASRSEVAPALTKTRGNLRQTYNVLMCAVRQRYSNTALGYYENIVIGHEFDASTKDSAAYAFAFDLCSGPRPWHWKIDRDPDQVKKSSRVTAQLFRERARKFGAGSPEVLLMTSFYDLYQGHMKERGAAYKNLLVVTKRAPQWADAYYWLGMAACNFGMVYESKIYQGNLTPQMKTLDQQIMARLGKTALRSYDRAEKLDSGLRPFLYLERLDACEEAATKKCAQMIPLYVEAHLKAFPQFPAFYQKQTGETVESYRRGWRNTAAKIAKEATS